MSNVEELIGLNKNLQQERLAICYKCPIYSPKFGGVCNGRLWLNPTTNQVSTEYRPGYVRGCSCRLVNKTKNPTAKCIAGKW